MKRYILTGTPGCGKTSIIRTLEMRGHFIVNEAATDVVLYEQMHGHEEPWQHPSFIDKIIKLQKQRQTQIAGLHTELQFYDRSPLCTYALAIHLGLEPSDTLLQEIERIENNKVYQKEVFFIENLGCVKSTDVRKISFEHALIFEQIHAKTYARFGYECLKISPAPLVERANAILNIIEKL